MIETSDCSKDFVQVIEKVSKISTSQELMELIEFEDVRLYF